jgi:hypothetical protein
MLAALLAPCVAAAEEVAPAPAFKPGMVWTYRQREELRGREVGIVRLEVIAVAPDRLTVNLVLPGGETSKERWDAAGNWEQVGTNAWPWLARLGGGASKRVEFAPALALYHFPMRLGASWVETARAVDPDSGKTTEVKIFSKALSWEGVSVPAGSFRALKVRRSIAPADAEVSRSSTTVTLIDWYSPAVLGPVKRIVDWEHQDYRRAPDDQLIRGTRTLLELTAFTPAP